MARVLVVGSVAYDTVETAAGKREHLLGGSATYFALSARLFSTVAVSGVVGEDFGEKERELLAKAGVDTGCLETVKGGRTFRWHGRYYENMDLRETVKAELNVLADFQPRLPDCPAPGRVHYRQCPFVFLANGSTAMQLAVLEQVAPFKPIVFFDTMDRWIASERHGVLELLAKTGGIILNDSEASALSGQRNLLKAARSLHQLGATTVIIKKGAHGVLALLPDAGATGPCPSIVALPAYPLEDVVDPTGAGDAFAGAFIGWLAGRPEAADSKLPPPAPSPSDYRQALAVATVTASFCVEKFGVEGLLSLDTAKVERRLAEYRNIVGFKSI